MSDFTVGPGTPLMCLKSCACANCNEGVTKGSLYTCEAVVELSVLQWLICGPCSCAQAFHPVVQLVGKSHTFCPTIFGPLGDPEEEVKETSEPKNRAPLTVKEFVRRYLEPENV